MTLRNVVLHSWMRRCRRCRWTGCHVNSHRRFAVCSQWSMARRNIKR